VQRERHPTVSPSGETVPPSAKGVGGFLLTLWGSNSDSGFSSSSNSNSVSISGGRMTARMADVCPAFVRRLSHPPPGTGAWGAFFPLGVMILIIDLFLIIALSLVNECSPERCTFVPAWGTYSFPQEGAGPESQGKKKRLSA